MTNLTGEQYAIVYTDSKGRAHKADIASLNGTLRTYTVNEVDVVVPFGADEFPPYFSGGSLFPYPNRLEDGRYEFEGVEYQTPINEIDRNNQLHSFSQFYNFDLVGKTDTSVELVLKIPARSDYPFLTEFYVKYYFDVSGLNCEMSARNVGKNNAPVGFGSHPIFSLGGDMDDANLQFSAEKFIEPNERLLPVDEVTIPERFDFSNLRSLKEANFDDAFLYPAIISDKFLGKHQVLIERADTHTTLIWSDQNYPAWQICSFNGVPDSLKRFGLAVEPMTCYANAFKTGRFLISLAPNQEVSGTWGICFE